MSTFSDFKIKKQLLNALKDQGISTPTEIQDVSYSTIMAGRDFVGIAQTGTGKTLAYLLPILNDLKFSNQLHPRVLILTPTRELVSQIVQEIEKLTEFISVRTSGVYGGTNINPQKMAIASGLDIIVGTPRRLYDLALNGALNLSHIKKLVIDEVDVMMDFGYKTQLNHIFDYLKPKRQNILFSATMTEYVDTVIDDFLVNPERVAVKISGTPLENIHQSAYAVPNFHTKANLLNQLLKDKETHKKVLIFMGSKSSADILYQTIEFSNSSALIHARKEQNYREKSIEKFESGESRILIATDVIARGIDFSDITTVISFNTPFYPENYIHRIGRTGRAGKEGKAILLYTSAEEPLKKDIEALMNFSIPSEKLPENIEISTQLIPEEKPKLDKDLETSNSATKLREDSLHAKKSKNTKQNHKETYQQQLKKKFKKPIRRGDKIQNMKSKKKRK